MKVGFSDDAIADLEEIGSWIGEDNYPRALSFIAEIEDRCWSLATFPERFPAVRELSGRSIRKLTHAGYLVFYAVAADEIIILRIVHGARDWAAFLDEIG